MAVINIHLGDSLEAMKAMEENKYDLAIVDPPYGIGDRLMNGGGKLKNTPMAVLYRESNKWDIKPTKEYFSELFRLSKNQIINGGNYFDLPPTRCFIFWDKLQYMHTLSQAEYIWTSFDKPSKVFRKSSVDLNRAHPTQKPVALYKWILKNYAKPGDKIIDTHGGSMSIAIACIEMGFDLDIWELDPEYFDAAVKHIQNHVKQLNAFIPQPEINIFK